MTLHPRLWATLATATMAVAGLSAPSAAAPSSPDGLSLIAVKHSLLGDHTWYEQTYRGLPVLGGFYAKHTNTRTGTVTTQDGRLAVTGLNSTATEISETAARGRALGLVSRSQLVVVPGAKAALAWRVVSDAGHGSMQTLVDAGSGAVLETKSLVREADGSGQVFNPNPVVALQNQSLTDSGNANSAVFAPAYKTVTLTQLDGTGSLSGAYANNVSSSAVKSPSLVFNYDRSLKGFEQVMAYYSITTTQEYIHSLGFTNVNNSAQKYRTTGLTADNSYYDPAQDRITFGTGGVDDAEDNEVIWHEYGHAIQDDQVPGFGSGSEAGAIGEAFGDYWAMSMSTAFSPNTATTPWACIADWDSTSYTTVTPHCLRRTDGNKVYPRDVVGEVHADGEMWSRALYDIFNALGRSKADRIVLESHFSYAPNTSFAAAANQVVATAQALYGSTEASACQAAMHARGFI